MCKTLSASSQILPRFRRMCQERFGNYAKSNCQKLVTEHRISDKRRIQSGGGLLVFQIDIRYLSILDFNLTINNTGSIAIDLRENILIDFNYRTVKILNNIFFN
jgi:hypothetical protein